MNHNTSSVDSKDRIPLQISKLNDAQCMNPIISKPQILAAEKKITLFALRLAVLEKTASGIGALSFIWATVVLLGGFAITLDKTDFWFITIILLIEGTRIFSRSHELEWQQQTIWSIKHVRINSFHALKSTRMSWDKEKTPTRVWASSEVPLLPYAKWAFLSRNVSKILYWLQLASATACVVLATIKLVKGNYGELRKVDSDESNRNSALIIFYSLALAEASLFLFEKAYWTWKVNVAKILDQVNEEIELDDRDLVSITRFFWDSYSRCVNGSVFDGLKMDMVSFAMELLDSDLCDEQLIGVRILRNLVTKPQFSEDTIKKIGINRLVMERLVEMLNWEELEEEEVRYSAADILSKLVAKKQNLVWIALIPGAMDSISNLLHVSWSHSGVCGEISEKTVIFYKESYGFWDFRHLGLQILKKLALDHDMCGKICKTRGLLQKIVDFIYADKRLLRHSTAVVSQILAVKHSLQILKMLSSACGAAGKKLRREILEIVFTISYLRNILRYGEKKPELQILGIDILTNLAMEEDATERIVATGGVLKELFGIFFNSDVPEDWSHVREAAGKALAILTLKSKNTCKRVMKLRLNENMIEALEVPLLRLHTAKILRSLIVYSANDCFDQLKGLTYAGPTILEAIMKGENKLQEVMIGAAACIFKFTTFQDSRIMFKRAGVGEFNLAHRLYLILKKYQYPSTKVPSIRRYTIELAIWMMRVNDTNIRTFQSLGMEREIESVTETTSELENFNVFCGTVGLRRQSVAMQSLVETALKLLEKGKNHRESKQIISSQTLNFSHH